MSTGTGVGPTGWHCAGCTRWVPNGVPHHCALGSVSWPSVPPPVVTVKAPTEPGYYQLCPVCMGRGSVPANFYSALPTTAVSTGCRRCHSTGTIPTPGSPPTTPGPQAPIPSPYIPVSGCGEIAQGGDTEETT